MDFKKLNIYIQSKAMSEDMRKMIDKVKNFNQFVNENVTSSIDDIHIKYETSDKMAYADIETNNDVWHISLIESKRKNGGTELLNKIISDAKNIGILKITLTTTEHSGWGFFDKFGFVEIGDNNDPYDIPMVLYI